MDIIKSKNLQVLHVVLGLFFIITGLFALIKANYLYGIWTISLGLLFLVDILKGLLNSSIKPVYLKIMHYVIVMIVLISGIIVLLGEL